MKLMHSGTSPFVRKVMVTAHELGLVDEIATEPAAAHPIDRSGAIRAKNPLGQVPTLVLDDGTALYDSRVICEYLDARAGGSLFGTGEARWRILTEQALADGVMAAGVLCRYEAAVRPQDKRWQDWTSGQTGKIVDALDPFEQTLSQAGDRLDIGTISIACALGYLDFRFGDLEWRKGRPGAAAWFERFAARPSMTATAPVG
jgi:glutathione S-transferase